MGKLSSFWKALCFSRECSHCFLDESVVFYVEQVAFAVAVRTTETNYWAASFADGFGGFALFSFIRFFEEHVHNFYCGIV